MSRRVINEERKEVPWDNAQKGYHIVRGGAEEFIIEKNESELISICMPYGSTNILKHAYEISGQAYSLKKIEGTLFHTIAPQDELFEHYQEILNKEGLLWHK